MKKKLISKTYLKGVTDWELIIKKQKQENYYLSIKQINEIEQPFIEGVTGNELLCIDNGYYIIEYTPLDKCYNGRAFLDINANVVGYYFDITNGNGVQDNIPFYNDLYLDIIYCPNNNFLTVIDEDELIEALNEEKITKEEFDLAQKECTKLFQEIKENKNEFVNMNKKEIIKKYFKI